MDTKQLVEALHEVEKNIRHAIELINKGDADEAVKRLTFVADTIYNLVP